MGLEVKPVKHYALLDPQGILVGYEESSEPPPPPFVELPGPGDLTPGKYRWDGERFVPIPKKSIASDLPPDAVTAFALGFEAIRDGKPLPKTTLEFLAWWRKSFDAKGVPE